MPRRPAPTVEDRLDSISLPGGGYSDQVAKNLGSAAILRRNLSSARHTGEMRRAVAPACAVLYHRRCRRPIARGADRRFLTDIANHLEKRSYRDSRTEGEE